MSFRNEDDFNLNTEESFNFDFGADDLLFNNSLFGETAAAAEPLAETTTTVTTTALPLPSIPPPSIPSNLIPTTQPLLVEILGKRPATEAEFPSEQKNKKRKIKIQKTEQPKKLIAVVTKVSGNQEIIDITENLEVKVSVIKNTGRMIAITNIDYDPAEMEEVEKRVANERRARQQNKVRVRFGTGILTSNHLIQLESVTQEEAIVRRTRQYLHRVSADDYINFTSIIHQGRLDNPDRFKSFIELYETIVTSNSFYTAAVKWQCTTAVLFENLKTYTPLTARTLRSSRAILAYLKNFSDRLKNINIDLLSPSFNSDMTTPITLENIQTPFNMFQQLLFSLNMVELERTNGLLKIWDDGAPLLREYCQGKPVTFLINGNNFHTTPLVDIVSKIFYALVNYQLYTIIESLWCPEFNSLIAKEKIEILFDLLKRIKKLNRPDLENKFISAAGGEKRFDLLGNFTSNINRFKEILKLSYDTTFARDSLVEELKNIAKIDQFSNFIKREPITFETLNEKTESFLLGFTELNQMFADACTNRWPSTGYLWRVGTGISKYYTGHPVVVSEMGTQITYQICDDKLIHFFDFALCNFSKKIVQEIWVKSKDRRLQYALMYLQDKYLLKKILTQVIIVCDPNFIQTFLFVLGINGLDIVSEVFNGFDSTWKSVNENKAQVLKNHLERTNPKGSVVAESNHVNMSPYASFFVLDLIQTAPHQQEAVPLQPPTSTGVNVNPVALVQTNQRSDQNQFLLTQNISQTFHGQSSTQQQPDDIFPTLELDDFLSNCFT